MDAFLEPSGSILRTVQMVDPEPEWMRWMPSQGQLEETMPLLASSACSSACLLAPPGEEKAAATALPKSTFSVVL